MKITLTPTQEASVSDLGAGRIWAGKTAKGTPLRVLISGLAPDSDDPRMVERFWREHDAIPELLEEPVCPDCGEPMTRHRGRPLKTVGVDVYQVIARFVIGAECSLPGGEDVPGDPNEYAELLREQLEEHNKAHHDRLVRAAHMVLHYVQEVVNAQQTPMHEQVAGNA